MSNTEEKTRALGINFGTASNRLRKTILYSMLYGKIYDRNCFRCGQEIEDVDDMSIEHKDPWQSATDPKAAFFDLENIAFSHLRCNYGEGNRSKTHCPLGHPLTSYPDRQRRCLECNKEYLRQHRERNPNYHTSENRRQRGWRE